MIQMELERLDVSTAHEIAIGKSRLFIVVCKAMSGAYRKGKGQSRYVVSLMDRNKASVPYLNPNTHCKPEEPEQTQNSNGALIDCDGGK